MQKIWNGKWYRISFIQKPQELRRSHGAGYWRDAYGPILFSFECVNALIYSHKQVNVKFWYCFWLLEDWTKQIIEYTDFSLIPLPCTYYSQQFICQANLIFSITVTNLFNLFLSCVNSTKWARILFLITFWC